MASTASLQPQQSHQHPPPSSLSPDTTLHDTKSNLSSPQNISTDREGEPSEQFSNSVTLQQRMDQFLSMTTAAAAAANSRIQSNQKRGNNHNNNSAEQGIGDAYQYQDASATSGSNSADEDDGESHQDAASEMSGETEGGNGKRSRGHFNGYSSSKKRRKQSKPIRLSAGDAPSHPQKPNDEDRSPNDIRHFSEEEDIEEGERVGRMDREEEEEYEEGARTDGPLNLSSTSSKDGDLAEGEEEGEVVRNGSGGRAGLQPSLRVLGAELLQANTPEGLAGLKIPSGLSAQQASSIPTSLYQGMLQFGLPPFPFPFPMTSQASGQPGTPSPLSGKMPPTSIPMSSSSSAPPLSAGGRVQIFNPEAYCELCNKEFCNKYFLKTHKANKHGIYSDSIGGNGTNGNGAPRSSTPGGGSNGPNSSPGPNRGGPDGNTGSIAGPPTPNSQAGGERGSPFSGAFIAANMGSLRPPFLPLSPGASPSPTSVANMPSSSNGALSSAQSGKELGSKEPNSLQRDAPSRGSEAGERDQASSPVSSSASATPRSSMPHGLIPGMPPSSQPNAAAAAAAAMMFSPGGTPIGGIPDFRQSTEDRERLMGRQFFDKELGELQRSMERGSPRGSLSQLTSGAFNPLLFGGIPSMESLKKQEEGIRREMGSKLPLGREPNSISSIPNLTSPSGGHESKGPFTPEKLRQMGVINADAFCEICCKEFCNKYFLRVHKLKKHGICSPDLPPEKVQKILNQMAKEAGKTGNPPPPIVRPPLLGGPLGQNSPDKFDSLPPIGAGHPHMPNLRPPTGLMGANLPPLEPLPLALRDALPNLPPPPQLVMEAGREKERQRLIEEEKERERADISMESKPSELRRPDHIKSPSKNINQQEVHNVEDGEREIIRINDDSGGEDDEDDGKNARGKQHERLPNDGKESGPNAGEDLQRLQSMIMELNSSKSKAAQAAAQLAAEDSNICKVCNKDMENKYFLRAHMMNEHGVLHMEDANQQLPRSDADPIRRDISSMEDEHMANGLENDFAAKFLQQMQKGVGGLPPPLGPGGDEHNFLERVKAELAAASGMNGSPFGKKLMNDGMGEKDPNRKPASLSRSYCEICKKELCNKYFMKTHMLKMHGINIESMPGAMGAVSQANPAPMGGMSGGVSCHICKKELCSKYFLKVHMQNSHGIMTGMDGVLDMPPGGLPPFPPGMVEGNGAVSNLFKGLFPMGGPPPELLSLPSGDQEKDRYFSRLLGEQSEISRERLKELENQGKRNDESQDRQIKHSCSLCGDTFPEIVALQVHIIKNHGAFPPEGLDGPKRPKSPQHDGPQASSPHKRGSGSDVIEGKDAMSIGGEGVGDTNSSSGNEEGLVATRQRSSSVGVDEDGEELNHRDERSSSASNTPQKTTTSSNGPLNPSSMPPLPAGFLDKQSFPHIEMLQRHMLSQQFPGLINPALLSAAGFPGFGTNSPSGNGTPTLSNTNGNFPGLQQLLAGGKGIPSSLSKPNAQQDHSVKDGDHDDEEREEGEIVKIRKSLNPNIKSKEHENDSSFDSEGKLSNSGSGRKIKRRFKCSKCNQKFRRRDICLRHIHEKHPSHPSVVPRRQLRFVSSNSPKKSSYFANKANTKARSHYVRQLMDLLKVPTSRGTPQKSGSNGNDNSSSVKVHHIMQAFLLKAPAPNQNNEMSANESMDDNGNNFVPSVVYLPVARRVSEPMTVAFDLTPA